MHFHCRTTRCLLYQRASLRNQKRCTACFTEKQQDLSILSHSDSRYVGRTSQKLQSRIKQHVTKIIRSCSSSQKRLLRCKSSTQTNAQSLALIQSLGFIFYKILSVLNVMMTVDSLFIPKASLLSIYLLLKPLSSKLPRLPSAD